jgi:hypothetical protein
MYNCITCRNRQAFSAGDCYIFITDMETQDKLAMFSVDNSFFLIKKRQLNLDQMNNSITCRNRQAFSAGDCCIFITNKVQ